MPHWMVDAPTTLDFDGVAALRVRVISGSVAVLPTSGPPRLDVADVTGQPLASLYEGEVDQFALETAQAVAARVEELDPRISAAAEGWTADRLGAVERNILRVAVYELEKGEVPLALNRLSRSEGQKLARMKYFSEARCSISTWLE